MIILDPATFPPRIAKLRRDVRGFPIPRFVFWRGDTPDFRMTNPDYWTKATRRRLCWICGEQMGKHLAFVCGPTVAISQRTTEPASHLECAEFAMRTCPFIAFPRRPRDEMPPDASAPIGVHPSEWNPGTWLLWVTSKFDVSRHGNTHVIQPGLPTRLRWMFENRDCTRSEVDDALAQAALRLGAVNPTRTVQGLLDQGLAFARQHPPYVGSST